MLHLYCVADISGYKIIFHYICQATTQVRSTSWQTTENEVDYEHIAAIPNSHLDFDCSASLHQSMKTPFLTTNGSAPV